MFERGSGVVRVRESGTTKWPWIVLTAVAWPAWHWTFTSLSAYPLSWLASLAPSAESEPSGPGGLYDSLPHVLVIAAIGLLFGYLGVYVLRRLGAPQVVWIPATIASLLLNLAVTVFWAGFSGSGTGASHIAGQFALTVGLSALLGVGAWLGSRVGRSA